MDDGDSGGFKHLFKVRCITCFGTDARLRDARPVLDAVRREIEALGYEVQMTRYTAHVLEGFTGPDQSVIDAAQEFERAASMAGVIPVSLGPICPREVVRDEGKLLRRLLNETDHAFMSVAWQYADQWGYGEAKSLAQAMFDAEEDRPGSNFRFGVSFNCQGQYIPYFPASTCGALDGEPRLAFSVGLENTGLLHHAYESCDVSAADPLAELTSRVKQVFAEALAPIERACQEVATRCDVDFKGIDTSIAPDLRGEQHNLAKYVTLPGGPSLSSGLTSLGARHFQSGSVATIRAITNALRDVPGISTTGYRGVMLPVLENESLVEAVANDELTVDKLLLCSIVCGVGLDVVPLAGGKTPEEREEAVHRLAGWLLDVAAISERCKKPLSVRVLPVLGARRKEPAGNFGGNKFLIEGALAM